MSHRFLTAFRFSTADLPPDEQFAAFRQAMSPAYDVAPLDGVAPETFTAEIVMWRLGDLKLGTERFDPHDFQRSPRRASTDGFDHYSVFLLRKGTVERHVGDHGAPIRAGRPTINDATQPLHVRTLTRTSSITLSLPRETLERMLSDHPALHGRVLEGAAGKLFAAHLHMLANSLPRLTEPEGSPLARATVEILAACLARAPGPGEPAPPPVQPSLLHRARRHMEPRLHSRELTPERIGRALGVSRSTLYALFEPYGGVAAYIRGRRLARIHALLADPRNRESIRDLALRHGFVSEAHFSRAFREVYGYPAREARNSFGRLPPNDGGAVSGVAQAYVEWARLLYA